MSITCEHAVRKRNFAVSADVAHCNIGDFQTHPCARFNNVCLALNKLNEGSADIAAAKDSDSND